MLSFCMSAFAKWWMSLSWDRVLISEYYYHPQCDEITSSTSRRSGNNALLVQAKYDPFKIAISLKMLDELWNHLLQPIPINTKYIELIRQLSVNNCDSIKISTIFSDNFVDTDLYQNRSFISLLVMNLSIMTNCQKHAGKLPITNIIIVGQLFRLLLCND